MPIQKVSVWVEPEHNPDLPVWELPDWAFETNSDYGRMGFVPRLARGYDPIDVAAHRKLLFWFHFCRHCEGWIPGRPNEYPVDSFAPEHLAGRQGTAFHCKRCGGEVAFIGRVS